jgi:glucosidase
MPHFPFSVDKFPDLLPLRNGAGQAVGLFSDHGSWLGVVWGVDSLLEIRDLGDGITRPFDLGSPLHQAQSWADHQAATLLDGTKLRVCFSPSGDVVVEVQAESAPEPQCTLQHKVFSMADQCWWIVIKAAHDTSEFCTPNKDLFEQNRVRWDHWLHNAFASMDRLDDPTSQVLLARAVTTLLWNLRSPREHLPHAGIIPSPFSYRGYWAWDSWKHAHALAWFAPELAAEQLRAQFCRQQSDGMVADTVMPNPADDNWKNSKPPLAAWALEAVWRTTKDADLLAELYPKCAAQLRWWQLARRVEDETLFRAGGVDSLTATWDTGWDLCHRFEGIGLKSARSWQLLDLWQPDLNAYILNDLKAMAAMATAAGDDPEPWRAEAEQLSAAIQRALWNEALGCFCDVRASNGASTGIRSAACWLPLWAGAASDYQRERTLKLLKSPNEFGTPMPFPSLAASEPHFDPDGYWNGSVWADHAAFAFAVLGERGFSMRLRMRDFMAMKDSLYECYSPLDGQPAYGGRPAVPQFSWTAAAGIEVLHGGPHPSPSF